MSRSGLCMHSVKGCAARAGGMSGVQQKMVSVLSSARAWMTVGELEERTAGGSSMAIGRPAQCHPGIFSRRSPGSRRRGAEISLVKHRLSVGDVLDVRSRVFRVLSATSWMRARDLTRGCAASDAASGKALVVELDHLGAVEVSLGDASAEQVNRSAGELHPGRVKLWTDAIPRKSQAAEMSNYDFSICWGFWGFHILGECSICWGTEPGLAARPEEGGYALTGGSVQAPRPFDKGGGVVKVAILDYDMPSISIKNQK